MLKEYTEFTNTTAMYPRNNVIMGLDYLALKLSGETAEYLVAKTKTDTMLEIGDLFWYTAQIYHVLDIDIQLVWGIIENTRVMFAFDQYDLVTITGQISETVGKAIRKGEFTSVTETRLTHYSFMLLACLYTLLEAGNFTLAEVLEGNVAKLTGRVATNTIGEETR